MAENTTRPLYIGNIPPEFADRLHVLTSLDGHPPIGSIESTNGRVIGLAADQGGEHAPPGVVLPDNIRFRDFAAGLKPVFAAMGIRPPETYWMPDTTAVGEFSTEAALIHAIQDGEFAGQFEEGVQYSVYPNRNAARFPEFIEVAQSHGLDFTSGLPYYDFSRERSALNRTGWARDPKDPDKPAFPDKYDIPYPAACLAGTLEELATAYSHVTERNGQPEVFIKRIHNSSGDVYPVSNWEDLRSTYEQLSREGRLDANGIKEPIELQGAIDIVASLSFQYDEGRTITPGGLTVQLFNPDHPDTWAGNIWNVPIPGVPAEDQSRLREEIRRIGDRVNHGLHQELGSGNIGSGGVDIAIVRDNGRFKAMALELNGGRITGAHPASALARTLGVQNQPFLLTKIAGVPTSNVQQMYELLRANGLGFDPGTKQGVAPLLWLQQSEDAPSSGSGLLLITAATQDQLEKILSESSSLLEAEGYTKS